MKAHLTLKYSLILVFKTMAKQDFIAKTKGLLLTIILNKLNVFFTYLTPD